MRRPLVLLFLALIVPALALAVYPQAPPPASAPAAPKIGFVDIVKVMQNCRQFKVYQASHEKLIQKLQEDEKGKEEELRLLNAELQKVDRLKYPEKWASARDEFIGKKAVYDIFQKQKEPIVMEQQLRDMKELLQDISKETRAYGKENGYFAILKIDAEILKSQRLSTQIEAELAGVIWSDPSADVTAEILKRLDAR